MKKGIIILSVAMLFTFLCAFTLPRILPMIESQPSNEDFLQAITHQFPDFIKNDDPVIAIESISRHDYIWYIATIRSTSEVENFVPVRVVLVNRNNTLSVILGPSVHFTEYDLDSYNLPNSVILELQK